LTKNCFQLIARRPCRLARGSSPGAVMINGGNFVFRLQNSRNPLRSYKSKPPVFISMARLPTPLEHSVEFQRLFAPVGHPLPLVNSERKACIFHPQTEPRRLTLWIRRTSGCIEDKSALFSDTSLGGAARRRCVSRENLSRGATK